MNHHLKSISKISIILLLAFLSTSCSAKPKGKLLLNAYLNNESGWRTYVYNGEKYSLLPEKMVLCRFSPAGELVACYQHEEQSLVFLNTNLEVVKSAKIGFDVSELNWSPNSKYILVIEKIRDKKGAMTSVIHKYDLDSDLLSRVHKLKDGISILNFKISENSKKIAFYQVPSKDTSYVDAGLAIYDFETNSAYQAAGRLGTFKPYLWVDDEWILSNTGNKQIFVNPKDGSYKETQEAFPKGVPTQQTEVTKDGKYFMTVSSYRGGQRVVLWPIDNPTKAIPITDVNPIPGAIGATQIWWPDWQPEN